MATTRRTISRNGRPSTSSGGVAPSGVAPEHAAAPALGPLRTQPPLPSTGPSLEAMMPGEVYMDRILSKLSLLKYEREFCWRKKPHRRCLPPGYFCMAQPDQTGNEQFVYFTSLAAWLLQLCGAAMPAPKEFDDPNTTLQTMMQALRGLGFAPPSYPPAKLMPGHGREVCALLDALLDLTLVRRGIVLSRPVRPLDEAVPVEDDDGAEDEAEDIARMVGQQDSCGSCDDTSAAAGIRAGGGGGASGGSSSSAAMDSLPLGACGGSCEAGAPWSMRTPADSFLAATQPEAAAKVVAAAAEEAAARQVLHTCVDPVQWRLEVERVAPRLRAVQAPSGDVRDWRAHLDAAQAAAAKLDAVWPAAQAALTRLGGELSASLERVATREEQLNGQFEGLLAAYGTAREQLTAAQEEHARRTESAGERTSELHRITAALEDVQTQLDARGSNLSDATPLVRLKASLAGLQEEVHGMELRMGVLSHNLMGLSLRGKQAAAAAVSTRQLHN